MATGINGVIAAVEVITMDGAEAEATTMDGGTIIAVGNYNHARWRALRR
jgi:hypothetical protein